MHGDQPELHEIHLRHGSLRMSICPELGGAITRLAFNEFDLLRPWDGSDSVRRTGCFVLAPFSNRIGNASFEHDGVRFPLRNSSADHPLPIHGVAWKRSWSVSGRDERSLTLKLKHCPDGEGALDWPFAFELEHELRLDKNAINLRLKLRNLSDRPMPAGLGWHPYFARQTGVVLQFAAESVWLNNERQLPAELSVIPTQWDFRQPRRLDEPRLDNCYTGWSGQARLHWFEQGIELLIQASAELDHLVVFTPPATMGFFALEPVSHANNAVNMQDPVANGVRVLAPGDVMEVSCRMTIGRDSF